MPTFDSIAVKNLYMLAVRGDVTAIECLHKACDPLIRVIAFSVDGSGRQTGDLIQEGHLKLQLMVRDKQYSVGRGRSTYAFFSTALRNHMVDCVRKGCREYPSEEVYVNADGDQPVIDKRWEGIVEYAAKRFPDVSEHVAADAACYVIDAVIETANKQSRGIIRTLRSVYGMNQETAYAFYWVMVSLLRMELLGVGRQMKMNGTELGPNLFPELSLLLGKQGAELVQKVFGGAYMKF